MRAQGTVQPTPLAWKLMARILAVGVACTLLINLSTWVLGRGRFGATDERARARIEQEVRATFDLAARQLRDAAAAIDDREVVAAAARGDTTALRRLFVTADEIVSARGRDEVAVTVYDAARQPLAWAGRPSQLAPDRLEGLEAWFIVREALGLRLVYVRPFANGVSPTVTIAAEHPLRTLNLTAAARSGVMGNADDVFLFPTRIAPVSIQLPFEGRLTTANGSSFEVRAPSGQPLFSAVVAGSDIAAARARWQQAGRSLSVVCLAIVILLLSGPLLDWRNRVQDARRYVVAVLWAALAIIASRLILRAASVADWSSADVFAGTSYASALVPWLLTSPADFFFTAAAGGGLAVLVLFAVERARVRARSTRRSLRGASALLVYLATQVAGGMVLAGLLLGQRLLLQDTIAHTTVDLLHFSLHPWDSVRLTMQAGVVIAHAMVICLSVAVLRAASIAWRVRRSDWLVVLMTVMCWAGPLVAWRLLRDGGLPGLAPLGAAVVMAVLLTLYATRLHARYRHGSQAFRLTLLTLALVVPAFAFYPMAVQLTGLSRQQLVETRYARQALEQRQTVQQRLRESLEEIDRFPFLADLVSTTAGPEGEALTDRAFQIWQTTALSRDPVTSSIELYGPGGMLVSRFAFNLPEDLTASALSDETTCEWDPYEEVAPFFAEERRVLHAGRALCDPANPSGPPLGSIVVHAILDHDDLPFIASRSPYVELWRSSDRLRGEGLARGNLEFSFYGWSRTPIYSSGDTAWPLPDEVFSRIEQSRAPFWAELPRGSDRYTVYLQNDRGGIYALGYRSLSLLDHLVNLAELTVLAVGTYFLILAGAAVFGLLSRRATAAPALLREVRASFYRKLFLAFVAAVFLPVVALALVTRNYVAGQMAADVTQEAIRTASAAARVVEDLVAPRAAQQGVGVSDNLMVWVSRLIDQDVNIFEGSRLLATSERNLFASGLVPTRTPAEVYHALELRHEAGMVARQQVGSLDYLIAGTPLTLKQFKAMLTVPFASRQQEIERDIDTLNRRVLLATLLFILAGAGLGYSMAERIADPVNRLSRATRRISRGELDARVAVTSSDELRRLVEDFNSMARELQRQRRELERTNRLEAWAEMARQVAHDIKNPLTPIQLNAEHLRRVHADRGKPLDPVLDECVGTILSQVKLLRQIAAEFSSFASSPTARPANTDVGELLREVVEPYRAGLEDRIQFAVDVPGALPAVYVDRTLIARALTNIVENALHAMPRAGTITVVARAGDQQVWIRVSDTGAGMDAEALGRAFEPYFSTKASGTGLGLPIAKRNVEASGGTISVTSERERGTTVELRLPVAVTMP